MFNNENMCKLCQTNPYSLVNTNWPKLKETNKAFLSHLFEHNCRNALNILVLNDMDIDFCGSSGDTPLLVSMKMKYFDVAKDLTRLGADVNKRGAYAETPLSWAVIHRSKEMAEFLLDSGAEYTVNSAFLTAIRCKNLSFVKMLRDRGARVNVEEVVEYRPLISAVKQQHLEIVEFLLSEGADVNERDEEGNVALVLAIKSKNLIVAETLLEAAGADVNVKVKGGATPLILAIECKLFRIVKKLVKKGADVNENDEEGRIPLIMAVEIENFEIVQCLVDGGADVNVNGEKSTPLVLVLEKLFSVNKKQHTKKKIVFEENCMEIIKCLLKAGADIYEKDKNGRSALVVAAQQDSFRIFNFLVTRSDVIPKICDIQRISKINLDFGIALVVKRENEIEKIKAKNLIGGTGQE